MRKYLHKGLTKVQKCRGHGAGRGPRVWGLTRPARGAHRPESATVAADVPARTSDSTCGRTGAGADLSAWPEPPWRCPDGQQKRAGPTSWWNQPRFCSPARSYRRSLGKTVSKAMLGVFTTLSKEPKSFCAPTVYRPRSLGT